MASVFDKRLNKVGNDLVFGKCQKYLGNGLDIYWARLKYFRFGISILQMTEIS